jgi:hypothetical protein
MKIFAIEFTNHCNAKCDFCPYPTPAHTRTKGFMSLATLHRIAKIATEPKALNISGLGEPLMHKRCDEFIESLRYWGFQVQLNTNGKLVTQKRYDQLWKAGLNKLIITADYFPWNKDGLKTYPELPVTFFTITRPPDRPELGQVQKPLDDWAGQVGRVQREDVNCSFHAGDFVQICWDGTIQRCCCDFNANEPLGNVHTWDGETWQGKKISLCDGCHGYIFKDGLVAGNYEGRDDIEPPKAFLQIE